jgi:phage baseplate assembly protein gpV
MSVASLPHLQVSLSGQPLPEPEALVRIEVHQRLDTPSVCELFLDGADGEVAAPGAELEVRVGPDAVPLFRGTVTARERTANRDAAPLVRLRAYDPLWRLRRTLSCRAHVAVSPAELLEELTRPLGLPVLADEPGPAFAHVLPAAASDLELLQSWCTRAGLHFFVSPRGIELFRLKRTRPVWTPRAEQLVRLSVEENQGVTPEVTLFGWHPRNTEIFEAHERGAAQGNDLRPILDAAVDSAQHAQALASAEADWFAARALVLRATIEDAPDLYPGLRLELCEQGSMTVHSGVVTQTKHQFDASTGHLVEASTEPPSAALPTPSSGLLWGVISRVDPDAFRVKVRMPTLSNVETDWLPVLAAGGGAKTGLLALPHLDDSVLVAHTHDDPGRAVVLGGLLGISGHGLETHGAELPFQFRSRGGHRLEFDDASSRLDLQDRRGSGMRMDSSGVSLTACGDLELRAPGRRILIAAARVDFEQENDS